MTGIIISGAIVLGVSEGSGSNLSDIDLTSSKLDSRLSYHCPSERAFLAESGLIEYAEPNIWPVEYFSGFALGRRPPEPPATNSILYSHNLTAWARDGVATIKPGVIPALDGGEAYTVTTETGKPGRIQTPISGMVAGDIYCESVFVHVDSLVGSLLIGNTTLGGEPHTVDFKNRRSTIATPFTYGFDEFPDDWLRYWYSGAATASGDSTFMISTPDATAFTAWGVQHESGPFPSSIIRTNGEPVTRSQAFAMLTNPGNLATSAKLIYSNGTSTSLQFNDSEESAIPENTKNWGMDLDSCISKCSFIKEI